MRLIDADALANEICKENCDQDYNEVCPNCYSIEKLAEAPTIDPASLRPKGEWEKTCDGEWMCTHCKEEVSICDCGKDRTYRKPFCPNCGADMRGEKDGNV